MTNIITSKTRAPKFSKHSPQGKGSARRPAEVDAATYADNYDRAFGAGRYAPPPAPLASTNGDKGGG